MRQFVWVVLVVVGACGQTDLEPVGSQTSGLYVLSTSIWSGSITVCWNDGLPAGQASDRRTVRRAVEGTWELHSGVDFVGWGACDSEANPELRIAVAPGGVADPNHWPHTDGLGSNLDGLDPGMVLSFTYDNICYDESPDDGVCDTDAAGNTVMEFEDCQGDAAEGCTRAIAVHEFGHALGFSHEQNRADTPGTCTDPPSGTHGDTTVGAWDLSSVMNYCNPAWNNDGKLSRTDILGLQQFYGAPAIDTGIQQAHLWVFFRHASFDELIPIRERIFSGETLAAIEAGWRASLLVPVVSIVL